MRRRLPIVTLLGLSLLLMGNQAPWRARRRPMPNPNRIAIARVALSEWPDEPTSPDEVDPARFAAALQTICGWLPDERAANFTRYVMESAETFDVDPFLLGALIFREGRCRSDNESGDRGSGVGLTRIDSRVYWENVRHGHLRYQVREEGEWVQRDRELDAFPFNGPRLMNHEANVYWAGALLSMWREQHESLAWAFEHAAHRHYVSHFIWGDEVRSPRQEDRILTERRRLLEYYGAHEGMAPVHWGGLELGCPLDGCPRVISSWIGSERDGGARHHRGVDVESLPGEPVRALADGLVVFAGVDLPGGQTNQQLRGQAAFEAIERSRLAAGGRYVCIRHAREDMHSVRTCYMHLDHVEVAYGQPIARGERVGTVGRTGMQRSAAHLHLEISAAHLEDPSEILYGLLLGQRDADPLPSRRR